MSRVRRFTWLASVVVLLMSASRLVAQITGDIQVKVDDPSGAAVSGATVTARSLDTGTERSVGTSPDGSGRIALLNVGRYKIRVQSIGFAPWETSVEVNSGGVADVKATLNLKTQTQEIVVSDQIQTINITDAQLQSVFTSKNVVELPLNTNTAGILTFAATAPGVVPQTPNNNNGFLGYGNFSSNGGPNARREYHCR